MVEKKTKTVEELLADLDNDLNEAKAGGVEGKEAKAKVEALSEEVSFLRNLVNEKLVGDGKPGGKKGQRKTVGQFLRASDRMESLKSTGECKAISIPRDFLKATLRGEAKSLTSDDIGNRPVPFYDP